MYARARGYACEPGAYARVRAAARARVPMRVFCSAGVRRWKRIATYRWAMHQHSPAVPKRSAHEASVLAVEQQRTAWQRRVGGEGAQHSASLLNYFKLF